MAKTRPVEGVDVDEILVRLEAEQPAIDGVDDAAVRRRQDLPGDGAEEGRRHEGRRHEAAHDAAARHVGARDEPGERRRDDAGRERRRRAPCAMAMRNGRRSVGSVTSAVKLARREAARPGRSRCNRRASPAAGRRGSRARREQHEDRPRPVDGDAARRNAGHDPGHRSRDDLTMRSGARRVSAARSSSTARRPGCGGLRAAGVGAGSRSGAEILLVLLLDRLDLRLELHRIGIEQLDLRQRRARLPSPSRPDGRSAGRRRR